MHVLAFRLPAGSSFNIGRMLAPFTLEVIGTTAFGCVPVSSFKQNDVGSERSVTEMSKMWSGTFRHDAGRRSLAQSPICRALLCPCLKCWSQKAE